MTTLNFNLQCLLNRVHLPQPRTSKKKGNCLSEKYLAPWLHISLIVWHKRMREGGQRLRTTWAFN